MQPALCHTDTARLWLATTTVVGKWSVRRVLWTDFPLLGPGGVLRDMAPLRFSRVASDNLLDGATSAALLHGLRRSCMNFTLVRIVFFPVFDYVPFAHSIGGLHAQLRCNGSVRTCRGYVPQHTPLGGARPHVRLFLFSSQGNPFTPPSGLFATGLGT